MLHTLVVRPTIMYGELDPWYVVSGLRAAHRRGGILLPVGDGTARMQVSYAGNVAWAHLCAHLCTPVHLCMPLASATFPARRVSSSIRLGVPVHLDTPVQMIGTNSYAPCKPVFLGSPVHFAHLQNVHILACAPCTPVFLGTPVCNYLTCVSCTPTFLGIMCTLTHLFPMHVHVLSSFVHLTYP